MGGVFDLAHPNAIYGVADILVLRISVPVCQDTALFRVDHESASIGKATGSRYHNLYFIR